MSENAIALDPDLALKRFFQDADWRFKIGVGAVINASALLLLFMNPMLLPICFCLWSLSIGYLLKVMRAPQEVTAVKDGLPAWGDWVELLISGLTLMAVATGWTFIVLSVGTIALLIGIQLGFAYASNQSFLPWAVGSVSVAVGTALLVSFLSAYLSVNMAQEEKMMAALAVRKVLKRFGRQPKALLQAWLLSLGLHMLAVVLPVITVVGIFFMPMTLFFAGTISATVLAQAWCSAAD